MVISKAYGTTDRVFYNILHIVSTGDIKLINASIRYIIALSTFHLCQRGSQLFLALAACLSIYLTISNIVEKGIDENQKIIRIGRRWVQVFFCIFFIFARSWQDCFTHGLSISRCSKKVLAERFMFSGCFLFSCKYQWIYIYIHTHIYIYTYISIHHIDHNWCWL